MKVLSLRNIPPEVAAMIESKAAQGGLSLSRAVIKLLEEQIERDRERQQVFHDLDHFAGCWTEEEAMEIEQSLVEARRIDAELWQ